MNNEEEIKRLKEVQAEFNENWVDYGGINEAFEKAYQALETPQGKWIPVSERLPDKNGRCLVTTDFGDVCMDSFVDDIFVLYLGNVIAWQPLPEPYKKGGAENA